MSPSEARDVILREEDFVAFLDPAARELGSLAVSIRERPSLVDHPPVVAHLYETSEVLEDFLDDHGARQNRRYAPFRELVASLRWMSRVKGVALHLTRRLGRFRFASDAIRPDLEAALAEARTTLDGFLQALLEALLAEARELSLDVTESTPLPDISALEQRQVLPRNLEADEGVAENEHVAEIAAKFIQVLDGARQLNLRHVRPKSDLVEFVAHHATEERCRHYESSVHNIQSMYDTYLRGTTFEEENDWILELRGHASAAFHLLEMSTDLIHFYERHENEVRHEEARERIAGLVPKADVLHVAVNLCLRPAYLAVEGAADVAQRILSTFVNQDHVELSLPDGIVLHARPLALIVQVARHYGTPIELSFDGKPCSASSLMGLIMLVGEHPSPDSITAHGDARALQDLKALFDSGLGERGDLPERLDYLRTSG